MLRTPRSAARAVACAATLTLASALAGAADAQAWNDSATLDLVRRAVARRSAQLADTALADYRAVARGSLTFLAQFGETSEPPKVVRADQLALEVHWRAPNQSKQFILGRRDTLLLPTDLQYHRDHLGIVQGNFPDIIRLGDGDEVRDVPHPLSRAGLAAYEFAVTDSLVLRLGGRPLAVVQVQVRPRTPELPRAVGAVFLDREDATVVRLAVSFTRAALKDEQLEDVAIVLDNGLVDGRFWLPRRQQVEIRRSATWLDFPVRGIIRGQWDICCTAVNVRPDPALFAGDEIVWAPPERRLGATFEGGILDALPAGATVASDAETREVQARAQALVRAQSLARVQAPVLAAQGVSDLARVNRAEGFALGLAASRQLGGGTYARLGGRVGFTDRRAKWSALLAWRGGSGASVAADVADEREDVSLVAERSGVANSLGTQEFASDASEPIRVRRLRLRLALPTVDRRWQWAATLAAERHDPAVPCGRAPTVAGWQGCPPPYAPSVGTARPLLDAWRLDAFVAGAEARHPRAPGWFGAEVKASLWGRAWRLGYREPAPTGAARVAVTAGADVEAERAVGGHRLVLRTVAGWGHGDGRLPPQLAVRFGGPVTAPGTAPHALAGDAGVSQRVEWRVPVPLPRLALGRFGRTGGGWLAPWVVGTGLRAAPGLVGWSGEPAGGRFSVGAAVVGLFDLMRVDVGRDTGSRGAWRIAVDVSPDLWRIL